MAPAGAFLTFINVSAEGRSVGKDVATKARVKSVVMKNLRRKQRLKEQQNYEDALLMGKSTVASASTIPPTTSEVVSHGACVESTGTSPDQGSGASNSSQSSNKASMNSTKVVSIPTFTQWQLDIVPPVASNATQQRLETDNRAVGQSDEQESIPPPGQLITHIHFFGAQIGDSASSSLDPKEFSSLLSTMEIYSQFLAEPLSLTRGTRRPIPRTDRTMFQNCFEECSFDAMILFTVGLSHLGHTTAIRYLPEDVPICAKKKAKVLSQIQRHISETKTNPPSPLLGAVMFLLSFEIIRGSPAVTIHLAGLARLVDMRGGIDKLPSNNYSLVPALLTCDMVLVATTTGTSPTFFTMDPPQLIGYPRAKTTNFYRGSPLMRVGDFGDMRLLYKGVPDVFVDILAEAFQGTWRILAPSAIGLVGEPKPEEGENDEYCTWSARHPKPQEKLPHIVAEACNVAGTIYYRATKQRIPFEDPLNIDDSKRLGGFLSSADLMIWRGIPYIYLWVLLTGAAAARSHPERQYLVARLIQFGFSVGLEQREDFQQIVLNFIWLRTQLNT